MAFARCNSSTTLNTLSGFLHGAVLLEAWSSTNENKSTMSLMFPPEGTHFDQYIAVYLSVNHEQICLKIQSCKNGGLYIWLKYTFFYSKLPHRANLIYVEMSYSFEWQYQYVLNIYVNNITFLLNYHLLINGHHILLLKWNLVDFCIISVLEAFHFILSFGVKEKRVIDEIFMLIWKVHSLSC